MNITETAAIVAAANQIDPRVELSDDTVRAWHRIIGPLGRIDCARAVDTHYAASTDRLMPAHVRSLVNGAPDAGRASRATMWDNAALITLDQYGRDRFDRERTIGIMQAKARHGR